MNKKILCIIATILYPVIIIFAISLCYFAVGVDRYREFEFKEYIQNKENMIWQVEELNLTVTSEQLYNQKHYSYQDWIMEQTDEYFTTVLIGDSTYYATCFFKDQFSIRLFDDNFNEVTFGSLDDAPIHGYVYYNAENSATLFLDTDSWLYENLNITKMKITGTSK